MILYSQQLYSRFERLRSPFERAVPHREGEAEPPGGDAAAEGKHFDVLLFGLGRYGNAIQARLTDRGLRVLGVDFDPEVVREWQARGHLAVYGDVLDPEFPATLPLHRAEWAISTIPAHPTGLTHDDPRAMLIQALRGQGFRGRIAVAASGAEDARAMRERGADLVLMPFLDAADQAVDLILGRDRRTPPHRLEAVATAGGQ